MIKNVLSKRPSVKVVEKFLRPIGMSNIVSIARKRDDDLNGWISICMDIS
ncbi:MAG: hypothetical protein WAK14_05265 [Methanobacterium sp.]